MKNISNDALIKSLQWRYAVKKFDPTRRIPDADWATLEQALILSPSSFGLQPWKFAVITSQALKDQLPAISWNQAQAKDCSHFVVFAARTSLDEAYVDSFLARTAKIRGTSVESLGGYKQFIMGSVKATEGHHFEWNARETYIALGQLMASAAVLGVDACPMEGIIGAEYDKLLGFDRLGYQTLVGLALGYRAADDKYATAAKVRFDASELILRK
jgi:nitroreductase